MMRKIVMIGLRLATAACVVVGLAQVNLAHAEATKYRLDESAKNRAEFHSDATLESFDGKAKSIKAEFTVDSDDITRTTGTVTIDLRQLDTGIKLRNKHMCENHLQCDSFPNAVFTVDSVTLADGSGPSLGAGSRKVGVKGSMAIHGQTRTVSVIGTVGAAIVGGNSPALRLQAVFPLKLADYGIPRPEFLFLKLSEEVKITVDLTIVPI